METWTLLFRVIYILLYEKLYILWRSNMTNCVKNKTVLQMNIERIKRMLDNGLTIVDISKLLNVSEATVKQYADIIDISRKREAEFKKKCEEEFENLT